MAKKEVKVDPPEEIPAWFMTYSDVITLLMTFFILLLTFATTEPERFEKVQPAVFGTSGATGINGYKHEKLDPDSWSQRVRPRAARIAMEGSEMPPITSDPAQASVGRGLEGVTDEEAKKDVMKTYSFELVIDDLINRNNELTERGGKVIDKICKQLQRMPVHCAFEFADHAMSDRVTALSHHMFHAKGVRPAQVGVGYADDIESEKIRIVIERYER